MENFHRWIVALSAVSVLLFVSSFVRAEDTLELEYEVSSMRDTVVCGDSVIVIHTVCAPICSSRAHIYNKEGHCVGVLQPPFRSAFPEAYIENGEILWRDNDTFDYSPIP